MRHNKTAMKIITIAMCFAVLVCFSACSGKNSSDEYDKPILEAVELIEDAWLERYENNEVVSPEDRYLEIKNTRVIKLSRTDIEMLEDIDYIIEFDLYTNFYGTKPYYVKDIPPDCVVSYSDGRMEVWDSNVMTVYRATTYDTDFERFVEYVNDYEDKYNKVITFDN